MKKSWFPKHKAKAFCCPHCGVYARQSWRQLWCNAVPVAGSVPAVADDVDIAQCDNCDRASIWHNSKMVYPETSPVALPNPDLNQDIQEDYKEASAILNKSTRGAAALLRLAIQKLSQQLGESGKDINRDIGNLVKKGLSVKIQKSLDLVRVIGNEAVHPGQIDLRDNKDTAAKLFELVNLIAQNMITEPKEIDQLYQSLPETKKKQIKKRDSKPKEN